ncbi:MAG TPA: hypothetical protein VHK88_16305 [Aquihabitans sp.]|nr:hypothetical protein [Aquihabitans sp.]
MGERGNRNGVGLGARVAVAVAVAVLALGVGALVREGGGADDGARAPIADRQVAADAVGAAASADDPHGDHHGPDVAPRPLAAGDQALLDEQLATSERVVGSHRTVADAVADGFLPMGEEEDRNDVHLVRWDRMDGRFDPAEPEMLLAASRAPDARIIAAVHYQVTTSEVAPEGFAGANDHWHEHRGICRVGDVAVGEGPEVDASSCAARGGELGTADGWMLHAWTVDGWANEAGVFVSDNAAAPR